MHLPNGTLLQGGKYRIVRFISSGGFGCTYEAEHVLFREKKAIKEFFVKDFCTRRKTSNCVAVATSSKKELVNRLRNKFIDEAKALHKMEHPNIVSVSDVFEENGTAYYVMDYIDGQSLHEIVKNRGALPESEALNYILQVADALEYVHSQKRQHLDVKPGNIMVNNDGIAVLIDFGNSKQYDEVGGENTSTILGYTSGYAPPEQIGNTVHKFTGTTDIYSLGATLYKLLTGITPPNSQNLLSEEETLQPLPDTISKPVRDAVREAMQLKRKDRVKSVADFKKLALNEVTVIGPPIPPDGTSNPEGQEGETQNPNGGGGISNDTKNPKAPEDPLKDGKGKEPSPKGFDGGRLKRWFEKTFREETFVKAMLVLFLSVSFIAMMVYLLTRGCGPGDEEEKRDGINWEVETIKADGKINGHRYVDLGLSVKWAFCNVNAKTMFDYGYYYAWGEKSPKSEYTEGNSVMFGKDMISIEGNSKYDVARAKWGATWRLPTQEEIEELLNKCKWEWVKNPKDGKQNGYKITGPNGHSIVIPTTGRKVGKSIQDEGMRGFYWSGDPYGNNSDLAYLLFFNTDGNSRKCEGKERYYGFAVRPVSE